MRTGRPKSDDPRQLVPFRIKRSLLAKLKRLGGREWMERKIEQAKDLKRQVWKAENPSHD